MDTLVPIRYPLSSRAPSRTWVKCQIWVPSPISTRCVCRRKSTGIPNSNRPLIPPNPGDPDHPTRRRLTRAGVPAPVRNLGEHNSRGTGGVRAGWHARGSFAWRLEAGVCSLAAALARGRVFFCRHTEEEAVMRVRGRKWGNSLALGIPRPFAGDADVSAGTEVDLVASEGRRVATPVKRRRPSLRRLLSRVTPDTLHGEVESGPPVGREALSCPSASLAAVTLCGFRSAHGRGTNGPGGRLALIASPASYNRKVVLALVWPITSQRKGYPFEVPLPAGIPGSRCAGGSTREPGVASSAGHVYLPRTTRCGARRARASGGRAGFQRSLARARSGPAGNRLVLARRRREPAAELRVVRRP